MTTDGPTAPASPRVYPEHEKMAAVRKEADTISAFLDGLAEAGIHLARYRCGIHPAPCTGDEILCEAELQPLRESPETILARHFGIDLKRIGAEKDAMLAEMRRSAA